MKITCPSLSLSAFSLSPSQIFNMMSWVSLFFGCSVDHPLNLQTRCLKNDNAYLTSNENKQPITYFNGQFKILQVNFTTLVDIYTGLFMGLNLSNYFTMITTYQRKHWRGIKVSSCGNQRLTFLLSWFIYKKNLEKNRKVLNWCFVLHMCRRDMRDIIFWFGFLLLGFLEWQVLYTSITYCLFLGLCHYKSVKNLDLIRELSNQ